MVTLQHLTEEPAKGYHDVNHSVQKEEKTHMGCWMGALGRLIIIPKPDNDLIMEYVSFSKSVCPKGYHEDEVFRNPWFFDEENRLASCTGKFCEPSVWYKCIKESFFEPRGYHLCGEPLFVGETDPGFLELEESRYREWQVWRQRVKNIAQTV